MRAVEATLSSPSYKVPKFQVNSVTLTSAAVRPFFHFDTTDYLLGKGDIHMYRHSRQTRGRTSSYTLNFPNQIPQKSLCARILVAVTPYFKDEIGKRHWEDDHMRHP